MITLCYCGHNARAHYSDNSCFFDYNCDCKGYSPREEPVVEKNETESARIGKLERLVAQQQNQITKLQQELLKASRYKNDDLDTKVSGIQVFLERAGEAQGRQKGRKR